jgi:hypothetical protein
LALVADKLTDKIDINVLRNEYYPWIFFYLSFLPLGEVQLQRKATEFKSLGFSVWHLQMMEAIVVADHDKWRKQ